MKRMRILISASCASMQRTLACHLFYVWCECIYLTKFLCTFEEQVISEGGLCRRNQLNHDYTTKLIAVVTAQ